MFTFAVERELIDVYPLSRFRLLPEERKALRVMTFEEERCLVEKVAATDLIVGAYVALLGETGLRKQEGLHLKWGPSRSQTTHAVSRENKEQAAEIRTLV